MKIVIKNGHVVDTKSNINDIFDILIEDSKIKDISKNIDTKDCNVIDAADKYVLPGFVDAHCHLRDPGFEYKEDIISGTKSAAMGGFTSIACMPNTSPVIDNKTVVEYIINKSKQHGFVNVYPIAAISKQLKGEELSEMGELKFSGAVALSDDGNPIRNSSLMKKALSYSSMFDIPIISHCEDTDLSAEGVMNDGYTATIMGLKGISPASEEIMIARDLILAEHTKASIHIAHVSTELSVDLIRNAKKRGVKVTAETCPHYFSLTENACEGFNTNAKVNPPLRTEKDILAIIEGLKDGTIDMIATDHAPHHINEKNVEFDKALNGMVGFETAFSLVSTYLIKPKHLTIQEVLQKMCYNPSKLLNLKKESIKIGNYADIVVVDVNQEYTVDVSKFKSKSRNSPFHQKKLNGKVVNTIVNGKVVVKKSQLICEGNDKNVY